MQARKETEQRELEKEQEYHRLEQLVPSSRFKTPEEQAADDKCQEAHNLLVQTKKENQEILSRIKEENKQAILQAEKILKEANSLPLYFNASPSYYNNLQAGQNTSFCFEDYNPFHRIVYANRAEKIVKEKNYQHLLFPKQYFVLSNTNTNDDNNKNVCFVVKEKITQKLDQNTTITQAQMVDLVDFIDATGFCGFLHNSIGMNTENKIIITGTHCGYYSKDKHNNLKELQEFLTKSEVQIEDDATDYLQHQIKMSINKKTHPILDRKDLDSDEFNRKELYQFLRVFNKSNNIHANSDRHENDELFAPEK